MKPFQNTFREEITKSYGARAGALEATLSNLVDAAERVRALGSRAPKDHPALRRLDDRLEYAKELLGLLAAHDQAFVDAIDKKHPREKATP